MRGARHYRPDVPTRLKKCSEHIGDDCTLCCAVTPCAYCIELEIYGGAIYTDYAPESADHWTGTVDGHAFDAFWERNQYTDECEFVVELDAVEVYRKSCYEGQECRDSSDETGVTIGYDEATLRWIKHEPLPLPHIIGDEGCPTWFCGECECSCECVCVVITEPDNTVTRGELCNAAYECEGPRWEGQIGYFDLALALGRDIYGNCVLQSTIDGEEQAAVAVVGCKDMSATITLYDGTTIRVACKVCACPTGPCVCCPGANIESSTFSMRAVNPIGPGATGCPEYPLGTGAPFDTGAINLTVCTLPTEIAAIYPDACEGFCTIDSHSFPGSFGSFDYVAVLICTGTAYTAFIKYSSGGPLLGLPNNEWIETAGGFSCPDCGPGDTGISKPVEMWYDLYVNCGVCNSLDFDIDLGECTPLILYSVRHYFESTATCL